jgi:hypothetical protein
MINETPDSLVVNGVTKAWSHRDAVCFSMIDGICVYESYSSKPGSHDFLIAALFHIFEGGQNAIKELGADGVMVKGEMNEKNKQKLQPLFDSIKSGKGGFNRNKSMKIVPDLVHGRLWTKEPKIVSFWNPIEVVKKVQQELLDFISIFDNPKNFLYDTNLGLISYEAFIGKHTGFKVNNFDITIAHTMPPSLEKTALLKSTMRDSKFGSYSPNYLSAMDRAKMGTSEGLYFAKWLKFFETKSNPQEA